MPAGDFDVLDGPTDLAAGIGNGLAVFLADYSGQLFQVLLHEVFVGPESLDAVGGRGLPPGPEGGLCSSDCGVHLCSAGEGDLCDDSAACGFLDIQPVVRR